MLLTLAADWRGVLCLVADAQDFEQRTGLEWAREMRFASSGVWVDLLQWTGRASAAEGTAREDGPSAKMAGPPTARSKLGGPGGHRPRGSGRHKQGT